MLLTLTAFVFIGLSGCGNDYVSESINQIQYAEPSDDARKFDLEGFISELPDVKFEKINYPIKEKYTYNFNNQSLEIDVPEGFEAYIIPLDEGPQVIESEDINDSCEHYNEGCWGPASGEWKSAYLISDDKLCITDFKNESNERKCNGILISPIKSKFKGVSLLDWYTHIAPANAKSKLDNKNVIFLISSGLGQTDLISDQQGIGIGCGDIGDLGKDLCFSILDSIKIQ